MLQKVKAFLCQGNTYKLRNYASLINWHIWCIQTSQVPNVAKCNMMADLDLRSARCQLHANIEEQYRGLWSYNAQMATVINNTIDENNRAIAAAVAALNGGGEAMRDEREPESEEEALFDNPQV